MPNDTPDFALTRAAIVDALTAAVRANQRIRAAWLGGSDASGRTDDSSDVDLCVVADADTDEAVLAAFDAIERALESLAPIEHRWHLPEPTWHGHAQRLYRLHGAPETAAIDLAVIKPGASERFLEPARHGTPLVLVDRDDLVRDDPLDRDALRAKMLARRDAIAQQTPFMVPIVRKAITRGHLVEAQYFLLNGIVRPLVDLIRTKHCPDRFDFGLRYLDRDVPPADRGFVESLVLCADADALGDALDRAASRIGELLRESADDD